MLKDTQEIRRLIHKEKESAVRSIYGYKGVLIDVPFFTGTGCLDFEMQAAQDLLNGGERKESMLFQRG